MFDWTSHVNPYSGGIRDSQKDSKINKKNDKQKSAIEFAKREQDYLQSLFSKVDNSKTKTGQDPTNLSPNAKVSVFYDSKGNELYKTYTNTNSTRVEYEIESSDEKSKVLFIDKDGDGNMDKIVSFEKGTLSGYVVHDINDDGTFDYGRRRFE